MNLHVKLVRKKTSFSSNEPILVLLPGGPGFSSSTLRPMDILARSFDLAYVDPPGTAGTAKLDEINYENVLKHLEDSIRSIERPVILLGHSFGGLYAIDLADRGRLDVRGLALIGSVLSKKTYDLALPVFDRLKTLDQRKAERVHEKSLTDESFAKVLSHYGSMYFSPSTVAAGSLMLSEDKMCFESFQKLIPVLSRDAIDDAFTEKLAAQKVPKLFIAGQDEVLFTAEHLRDEAVRAGCKFRAIERASHFVFVDQPEQVAREVEIAFPK